jgi:DUF971 family protein
MYETRNVRSDLAHHEKGQEGIIVWDHKGVVILWPEGHSSRFAWSTLRALCTCTDCQRKTARAATADRYAA